MKIPHEQLHYIYNWASKNSDDNETAACYEQLFEEHTLLLEELKRLVESIKQAEDYKLQECEKSFWYVDLNLIEDDIISAENLITKIEGKEDGN